MRVVSAGTLMTYQSMSPVVSIAADATSPSAAVLAVAAVLFGSVSVIFPVGDKETPRCSGLYSNSGCENRAAARWGFVRVRCCATSEDELKRKTASMSSTLLRPSGMRPSRASGGLQELTPAQYRSRFEEERAAKRSWCTGWDYARGLMLNYRLESDCH